MSFDLSFDTLIDYDAGQPGISLDVEISLGKLWAFVTAKIDTGATHSIFSRAIGEQLGITIEDGIELNFRTAAGSFTAYGHSVTLKTAGLSFDSEVYFTQFYDFDRNVLGRQGWLDRVVIGINDYDGKLYLKNYE